MIEILSGSEGKILGIKVTGKLTDQDYREVLIPALEAIIEAHGKARFICCIDQSFAGMEAGAIWDDTKFYFKHKNDMEKVALVGGQKWIEMLMKVFAHFMPGDSKTFTSEQLQEAWDWIVS
jgi:hypothetical protein